MTSVGSAEFFFRGDAADLVKEGAAAEAAVEKNVKAISQATGVAERDVKRYADVYVRESKRAADARAKDVLRIIKAENDAASAASQQASGNENLLKSIGKLSAGYLTLSKAMEVAENVGRDIIENARKQEQAQFAVNKLYAGGAKDISDYSAELAKYAGRSKADGLEAAGAVANLGRQYALTSEQQKQVLKISSDVAALKGIPIEEATKRVSDALRGEAEAAEYLGQVLNNDAVKAFANMTDEQRKNFETLSPITKAQIVLGKLTKDNADLTGTAAERLKTLGGALDNANAKYQDLTATIGSQFTPSLIKAANQTAQLLEFIEKIVSNEITQDILKVAAALNKFSFINPLTYDPAQGVKELYEFVTRTGASARKEAAGVPFGPTPEEVKDAIARYQQLQAAQSDAVRLFVDERKKAISTVAEAQEKAARDEAKRVDKAIEQEKIRLEVEKEGRLKALAERERDTLDAIKAEADASKKASEQAIDQAERERDVRVMAIEEAAKRAEDAIKSQQEANARARELEDRAREDERKLEDQDLEDLRQREDDEVEAAKDRLARIRAEEDRDRADRRKKDDDARAAKRLDEDRDRQQRRQAEDRDRAARQQAEDRARQQRREAEDRDREARREAEDEARDDARRKEDQALEEAHEQTLARLEAEQKARLDAIDDQIEALKSTAEAEEKAREQVHEAALKAFAAEEDAARRAHDEALDALKEQARAEDDRHRNALAAIDAEKDARLAAIDAELGLLDAADDAAQKTARDQQLKDNVTNAQFGVKKAESTGNQSEIEKAEQELAAAVAAIRQAGVKDERDAQRQMLLARKQAIQEDIDAQKRAEDERNRIRERELQAAEETADDALAAQLAAINERKDAETAAYELVKEKARASLAFQLSQLEERKDAEQTAYQQRIDLLKAEYDDARQKIEDRRRDEDRALDDRRKAEDLDREDRRRKEDTDRDDKRRKDDDARADKRRKDDDARADDRKKEDEAIAASRLAQDRRRTDERKAEDDQAKVDEDRRTLKRKEEDRLIDERRVVEDRDRADRRTEEDKALKTQLDAVKANQDLEKQATEEHYNGPNGVITKLRKAMQDAEAAYQSRLELAKRQFDQEKDAINAVYRNTAKTGLLDLQDEAARNNAEKLGEQLGAISSWKEQANSFIDENKGKWKDLAEAINDVNKAIKNLPKTTVVAPNAGGGYGNQPYGPPDPGADPGPNPPPTVTPTPAPGMGSPSPGSGAVNVDPGRFTTSFGFLARYTNPFNPRIPRHRGVDLVVAGAPRGGKGLPVGAFRDGTVTAATIDPNGGNGVTIRHTDGLYGRYFHFDAINARQGQTVRRGDQIGILGESGTEGSPHLHYEISRNGSVGDFEDGDQPLIDPTPYMRDSGHLFRHPTYTYTPATGERNLIAERRPERLLGGAETAREQQEAAGSSLRGRASASIAGPTLLPAAASLSPYRATGTAIQAADPSGGNGVARERQVINVTLGNLTLERIAVTGLKLAVERGTTLADLGLN